MLGGSMTRVGGLKWMSAAGIRKLQWNLHTLMWEDPPPSRITERAHSPHPSACPPACPPACHPSQLSLSPFIFILQGQWRKWRNKGQRKEPGVFWSSDGGVLRC